MRTPTTMFVLLTLLAACRAPAGASSLAADETPAGADTPSTDADGTPVTAIDPQLLDNADQFTDAFYLQFQLRHAAAPLQLPGGITKDYDFPTLYGDVTTAIAMFYCSYDQAQALLPSPDMHPVDMGLGHSLVIISSYRYNKVLGLRPYNEIAISIPVLKGDLLNPPVAPLLVPDYPGMGFYVVSMPVTTLENQVRGTNIWGLPKVVQEIDLSASEDGGHYTTTAKDENGVPYLTFTVPTAGLPLPVDQKTYLYSVLDGAVVRSPAESHATFQTSVWPLAEATLTLGDSPAADTLKQLQIDAKPFQVRYSPAVESIFDLPEGSATRPL